MDLFRVPCFRAQSRRVTESVSKTNPCVKKKKQQQTNDQEDPSLIIPVSSRCCTGYYEWYYYEWYYYDINRTTRRTIRILIA
jgi:hypothetical protein